MGIYGRSSLLFDPVGPLGEKVFKLTVLQLVDPDTAPGVRSPDGRGIEHLHIPRRATAGEQPQGQRHGTFRTPSEQLPQGRVRLGFRTNHQREVVAQLPLGLSPISSAPPDNSSSITPLMFVDDGTLYAGVSVLACRLPTLKVSLGPARRPTPPRH